MSPRPSCAARAPATIRTSISSSAPPPATIWTASKGSDVNAQALLVLRYNLFRGGGDIAREREAFSRVKEARESLRVAQRDAEEEARVALQCADDGAGTAGGAERMASRRSARPATSMPSSSISASAACSICSTPRTSCSSPAATWSPPSSPRFSPSIASSRSSARCWTRWRSTDRRRRSTSTGQRREPVRENATVGVAD